MKAIKKIGSIFSWVFYMILSLLIVSVLGAFIMGIKPHITMSGSMEPIIHTGSVCFVDTKAEYDEMQVGDIIAFEKPTGGQVTHRVIGVSEEGLETKGDANEISDGITTTRENFYGETLFSVPYVGYALAYLQKPLGIAIMVILIVTIILFNVVDAISEKKEETNISAN